MLLQISEPGQSKAKEACKKVVVGIDLGTTNSLVAIALETPMPDGTSAVAIPGVDPMAPESTLLPSVVHYPRNSADRTLVGRAAMAEAVRSPASTVFSAKRLIGRGLQDVAATLPMLPYTVAGDERGVHIAVPGRAQITPVEVSAEILRALKRRAEEECGAPIEGAVITVPAYFDDAQRQATRDAGRLAGLEVLRLLAEPTAAALAYGLDRQARGTYAVYDLGGGTFDISVLKLVDGVFDVKSTGGDSALGGDDIDRALATAMFDELVPASAPAATRAALLGAALVEARRVKEALTEHDVTEFRLVVDGVARSHAVDRARLAEVCRPLLERTGRACRRALKDAEVSAEALDGVVLVGGSTRSPVVRAFVTEVFGREPLCDLDPDQVVALGAAIQADVLAGGQAQVVLLDVVPLSLGVEMMGGVVEKLLHRNTTMPCGATQVFTTYADNQTGFAIHVVQGERETADACRSLARFTLRGIPPMVAGMGRVEITFMVDADGLLRVMAKELTTGIETSVEVKPSYGLTDEEVERMLVESFDFAEDDLRERNLRVERIEAERILAATRAAFAAPDGLLDDEVEAAGQAAMGVLESAMAGRDHLAIRAAVEALDLATKPFAQARMNRAIGTAMHGRALDDVEAQLAAPAPPSPGSLLGTAGGSR